MTTLKEENSDAYVKQFSRFVKVGIQPTSVEFHCTKIFFEIFVSFSLKLYIKLHMWQFVLIHHHRRKKRRKRMLLNQNDGIKLDSLDHHAEIVFNNERPLFLKLYKVVILNRRISLLLPIVITVTCFFSEECSR